MPWSFQYSSIYIHHGLMEPSLSPTTQSYSLPMIVRHSDQGSDHQPGEKPDLNTTWSLTVIPTNSLHSSRYEVVLEPADDPQKLPLARRWLAVLCISTAA